MAIVVGAVQFKESKLGKTGLAVAGMVKVYEVAKNLGSSSLVINGGNAVEVGDGFYGYSYGAANTVTSIYLAVFTTATLTVDDRQPSVWLADIAEQAAITALNALFGSDGYTLAQAVGIMLAALTGKTSGMGTPNPIFRNLLDTLDRIAGTVDASGNRTGVVITP